MEEKERQEGRKRRKRRTIIEINRECYRECNHGICLNVIASTGSDQLIGEKLRYGELLYQISNICICHNF